MNKKLMAVAVAGVMAAPVTVLAQSTVNIYGRINQHFENVKASGSTPLAAGGTTGVNAPSRFRSSNYGGTSLGFRGSEKLGGGLSAVFQLESNASVEGAGATMFTRNSGVGLRGGFGTVMLANWDTPYKQLMSMSSATGLTGLPGSTSIMGNGNGSSAAAGVFSNRQGNSVYYVSPSFSGFELKAQYSPNEAKTAVTKALSVWSLSGVFRQGPFAVGAAWEQHNDRIGNGLDDTGWMVHGSFTFAGSTKIGGAYERLKYDTGPGLSTKRNSYMVNITHRTGPHTIIGQYVRASNSKGNGGTVNMIRAPGLGNTGANLWVAQYRHNLSKRTALVASAARLSNKANAIYNLQGGGNPILAGSGGDPQGFGFGIDHRF